MVWYCVGGCDLFGFIRCFKFSASWWFVYCLLVDLVLVVGMVDYVSEFIVLTLLGGCIVT